MQNERLTHPEDADFAISTIDSTGLLKLYDTFDIKPGNVSVKLPSFTGYIFDDVTTTSKAVTFNGVEDYAPAFLMTANSTYVLIDATANINVQSAAPTSQERQTMIYLCEIQHPLGSVIAIIPGFDYVIQEANTLGATIRFLNSAIKGCRVSANGSNMQLDIQAGVVMLKNSEDSTRASVKELPSAVAYNFNYVLHDDTTQPVSNSIDPDNYDNGGVVSAVPAGMFTIQRVSISYDGSYLIQYGNQLYTEMALTYASYNNIDVEFPKCGKISSGATFAYISIKQGTVALDNTAHAQIIQCNNFGEVISPKVNDIGVSLLAANNLSDVGSITQSRINLGAGSAGGLATLGIDSKVTASQLPFNIQPYSVASRFVANSTTSKKIADMLMDNAVVSLASNIRIQFYADIVDRTLLYSFDNDTALTNLASGNILASGLIDISVPKPLGSGILSFSISKSTTGGTGPVLRGLIITYQ